MLEQRDLEMIAGIMNQSLEPVKCDINDMKTDIKDLKKEVSKIAPMQADISSMKQDISGLNADMDDMQQDISDMKSDIKTIELKLENDIQRGIDILVDGHSFLVDKLDTMSREQVRIEQKQDIFELHLKNHATQISQLASRFNSLPCQNHNNS